MSHSSLHATGRGIPTNPEFAQIYWIFAGSVIVIASLVNLGDKVLYRQRLSAASKSGLDPARPKNAVVKAWATITAVCREAFSATLPALVVKSSRISFVPRLLRPKRDLLLNLPPLGRILVISANIALLCSIAFWKFRINFNRDWEDIAFRAAWLTVAQLPLVFLMAGKRNIVGFLTGSSYERLNWIHRWVARCMFITASIHMGYFFKLWDFYLFRDKKLEGDIISRRGLGAYCILIWIMFSSVAPIRNLCYEVFVIQHAISYIGFITMVVLHVPVKALNWIWVPIALFFTDRLVRTLYILYNNFSIFHPTSASPGSIITCKATFTALPDRATLVTIPNPPFRWSPGQHVFLSCPTLLPLQSHPFTITSLPSDKSCDFIIRAHRGGTHRLFRYASSSLPPVTSNGVFIDGPYGRIRPLEQFDTVVLIAGSTGATFTVPLLRDLVRRYQEVKEGKGKRLVTQKVKFVWVVKNRNQVGWFARALQETLEAMEQVKEHEGEGGLVVEMSVYITCDDTLTSEHGLFEPDSSSSISSPNSRDTDIPSESSDEKPKLCGGDRCCCINIVLEAKDGDDKITSTTPTKPVCTCGMPVSPTPTNTHPTPRPTLHSLLSLPPCTTIKTGRPAIRSLINKELEQSRGEAAVAVCGPKGLIELVRHEVVGLCDERAVCKGSGAMGVYLHTEGFGW